MIAVIMAGGRGTRIASVAEDIPKPMIPVCGKPVLEREICCLRDQGFKDIYLTVSYMGKVIMDYFGDGSGFGVNIRYYYEREPLGNAGALFRLRDELKASGDDSFLLLNADSIFDVDFNRMVNWHRESGADVTLFTHPNSHPYDSGLVITDEKASVVRWLSKEDERPKYYRNRVNAGLHVMKTDVLDEYARQFGDNNGIPIGKVDLDRQLLKPLAGTGRMYAYDSPEYVRDMGTPDRYATVCRDYEMGLVSARNLSRPQKSIFLDRDGTINRYVGFLRDIDEFELLPEVAEAIHRINESGYLAIVVTNQPVIARGDVTYAGLEEIHNKMETLLGVQGAYLDAIYYCPHHPDSGFEGEVTELKIECECRKPKPGMLLKAAKDFNIDLSASWMIGDGKNDVLAGKAAGVRTGYIGTAEEECVNADISGDSLAEIVDRVLQGN